MSFHSSSILTAILALTVGSTVAIAANPSSDNVFSNSTPDTVNSPIAQRPNRGRGVENVDKFMEQLNLTEDQKRQISAIREKYQAQMQQLRTSEQANRQELETMMSGNASNDQLRSKHQQMVQTRERMNNLRFESLLEMRQVLTPAQRNQLAQLMQERRNNVRMMRNQRPNNNQN